MPRASRRAGERRLPACRRVERQDLAMEATSVEARRDRLLPWIAAERAFRAIVLLLVGVALVSHPHANWATEISRLAERLGLNPSGNWIRKLIVRVRSINASEDLVFGIVAIAYGALEATESYGLWRRRRWGEWLTVVATSLLLVPEVWELTKGTTLLKVGALIANLLIVAYLLWRLRRG
jgi:uncharacterized membrane protein (DUF2068 family)